MNPMEVLRESNRPISSVEIRRFNFSLKNRMGLTGGKPPSPQPRNLAGQQNSPGDFGRFPGNSTGDGFHGKLTGGFSGNGSRDIPREIPRGSWLPQPRLPGNFPGNSTASISRGIFGISRRISREMDFAGNRPPGESPVGFPGKLGSPPGEFPGEFP